MPKKIEWETTFFKEVLSLAPKYLEATIPNPSPNPLQKPTINSNTAAVLPMAARGKSPRKCPIIRVSMVLYNCWNRLEKKKGMENRRILFVTGPLIKEIWFIIPPKRNKL